MNKTIFTSAKELIDGYNAMIDKVTGVKLSNVSDDDLYVLCLGDTFAVRKNMEAALKVANGHFESPESIQNYRKLMNTPDLEKFIF